MAAAGYLLDLVLRYASAPPVYLDEGDKAAVAKAKQIIRDNVADVPTILELCRKVSLNKNKLQKAFQLTEGKSIGEYARTLRMELALDLLEKSDMTMQEIAKAVGCQSISNFYRIFKKKFGETPQTVRDMLQTTH